MRLNRIPWGDIDWVRLDAYPDRTVFQTKEWLQFVAASQGAEPVVAKLTDGGREMGFFTGLIVRKFGFRLLGSPFPGWTTSYMGFNLEPGVSRTEATLALPAFAFGELKCVHLEVCDRRITMGDASAMRFHVRETAGFEVSLAQTEDQLFANMTSACRRAIRKSGKSGVTIEQVRELEDARAFVHEYYDQLSDVFEKQSLVPTYPRDRVSQLVEHVFDTGNVLLLRARDPEGACIATGIFPAFNDTMFFWGGASWRSGQPMRPNEAVQWHAMRYWRERGITRYDMSGRGDYKRKYGGNEISVPALRISRVGVLELLRNAAKSTFRVSQRVRGAIRTL